MMLLEHDAKVLLAEAGLPIPPGRLLTSLQPGPVAPLRLPLVVKAQVPVGGRGKAGGIARVETDAELAAALRRLLGTTVRGHPVRGCRIEEIADGTECYLSFLLDPTRGRLKVLIAAEGGMDIESASYRESVLSADVEFTVEAAVRAAVRLAEPLPSPAREALGDAVARLAPVFFALEATLLEVNPLFVRRDGSWAAGDVKLAVDENAFVRQPRLSDLIRSRADAYPEASLKLSSGFDFVMLDPDGDIGLVTTGAGLSMQLVDELIGRGHRPYNFCDIRTGQFRGDPARLIQVLQWIAAGPSVRSVLMNFFAGITHLGELAHVLVAAIKAVPQLRAPVTARLIGNGYDEATAILAAAGNPLRVETDLERAITAAVAPLGRIA